MIPVPLGTVLPFGHDIDQAPSMSRTMKKWNINSAGKETLTEPDAEAR